MKVPSSSFYSSVGPPYGWAFLLPRTDFLPYEVPKSFIHIVPHRPQDSPFGSQAARYWTFLPRTLIRQIDLNDDGFCRSAFPSLGMRATLAYFNSGRNSPPCPSVKSVIQQFQSFYSSLIHPIPTWCFLKLQNLHHFSHLLPRISFFTTGYPLDGCRL